MSKQTPDIASIRARVARLVDPNANLDRLGEDLIRAELLRQLPGLLDENERMRKALAELVAIRECVISRRPIDPQREAMAWEEGRAIISEGDRSNG